MHTKLLVRMDSYIARAEIVSMADEDRKSSDSMRNSMRPEATFNKMYG